MKITELRVFRVFGQGPQNSTTDRQAHPLDAFPGRLEETPPGGRRR